MICPYRACSLLVGGNPGRCHWATLVCTVGAKTKPQDQNRSFPVFICVKSAVTSLQPCRPTWGFLVRAEAKRRSAFTARAAATRFRARQTLDLSLVTRRLLLAGPTAGHTAVSPLRRTQTGIPHQNRVVQSLHPDPDRTRVPFTAKKGGAPSPPAYRL